MLSLFFFISISSDSVFAELSTSEKELLDKIIELESQEKFHTALGIVEDFLDENPDSFEAKTFKCGLLNNVESPVEEIKECLDDVASINPTHLRVMLSYGVLHFNMEEYEESRDIFKEIMKIYPYSKPAESRFYTISLLLEPDNDEYVEKLKELFAETNDLITLNNLIKHLNDRNNFEESNKFLKISEEMDENNVDALTHRGVWYAKQGDLQSAERFFEKAITVDPEDVSALLNQALVYKDLGDLYNDLSHYQKSQGFYKSVLTLEPENTFAQKNGDYVQGKILEIQNFRLFVGISIILIAIIGVVSLTLYLNYNKTRKDEREEEQEEDPKRKKRLGTRIIGSKIFMVIYSGFFVMSLVLLIVPLAFPGWEIFGDTDMNNWGAIVIEIGIGVMIVGLVAIIDSSRDKKFTRQQTVITNLANTSNKLIKSTKDAVGEIKRIEKNQQDLIKEVRGFIKNENERIKKRKTRFGTTIHKDLSLIKDSYIILEDWIKKYQANPTAEQKSDIIRNAKNHGHNVKIYTQYILEYLPKIESDFNDPVLGTNLFNSCKKYPDLFLSIENEHHWTPDGLNGILMQIDAMKKILDRDIPRILKES